LNQGSPSVRQLGSLTHRSWMLLCSEEMKEAISSGYYELTLALRAKSEREKIRLTHLRTQFHEDIKISSTENTVDIHQFTSSFLCIICKEWTNEPKTWIHVSSPITLNGFFVMWYRVLNSESCQEIHIFSLWPLLYMKLKSIFIYIFSMAHNTQYKIQLLN
jgi:hypothetical protein